MSDTQACLIAFLCCILFIGWLVLIWKTSNLKPELRDVTMREAYREVRRAKTWKSKSAALLVYIFLRRSFWGALLLMGGAAFTALGGICFNVDQLKVIRCMLIDAYNLIITLLRPEADKLPPCPPS